MQKLLNHFKQHASSALNAIPSLSLLKPQLHDILNFNENFCVPDVAVVCSVKFS